MPVSILTALILWSSSLAPSSGIDEMLPANVGRMDSRLIVADPSATISSWPVPEPCSWTFPDVDLEEEESNDGEPEAIVSEVSRLDLFSSGQGQVLTIRLDREIVLQPTRSQILRC